ncbi:septum site-determining protein MinC [Chromatiaceae bacterium AAb-1]|nr:septum site-determining protein MinC [Chromatiaceae bacterium AAb-1]
MSDHSLELKGSLFPLSVLHCQDLTPDTLKALLTQKLAQAPGFFYQAPVVLNLAECQQQPDFLAIKQLFTELELVLVGVCGASAELKKQAQQAGLAALQLGKDSPKTSDRKKTATEPPASLSAITDSKIIEQTVRSGQQIYAKGTDLIIKGSVGAGAEVIADGNIHIYGSLRGKAIAGASGDKNKRIFCHNLQAELVSVAGNYWLSESLQGEFWGKAACIRLHNDQLMLTELV